MKILELSLQAFGPFTDVTLDFSGGREGLHLVHGPNEAGKSSALRALRQALFGFPVQSPDDFLHSYQKLRVGLRVRGGDGGELAFVRRKGAKNTLLAADGATPLPDSALARILGGVTEPEFSGRFALDHDELVAGGKSILQGAGELGQLLFQAGGGLKDLLEVQRGLDRELESLFKPTGAKPRINARLAELKEAKGLVREGSLPSTEWVEHDAALRRATGQLEQLEGRLEAARAEKRRLERIADALPLLARRRQCREELEALEPFVLLPDDFTEQRHQATGQLEAARTAESAAVRAIAELDAQIGALVVPEDLLAEAEAVERLRDALAGYQKARAALPGEQARLRLLEADVHDLLAGLRGGQGSPTARSDQWSVVSGQEENGSSSSLTTDHCPLTTGASAASDLRPTRAQKASISRLAGELARLIAEQDQAVARAEELAARLESEQSRRDRLEAGGDPEPLAIALRQARDQGDLDAQLESARARLEGAEREAAQALAGLPMWSGPREAAAVSDRPVPAPETVDRFEAELADVEAELARLRAARAAAVEEAADAESKLAALRQSAGVLPTEDDLAEARARRDRTWRLVRRSLEPGDPPGAEEVRAALAEGGTDAGEPAPAGLAPAYERAVERADACADRLRREAERVAAQAGARADLERSGRRLAHLDEQGRQADARADDARARWRAAWEPAGLVPLSPREMRGWLQARQAVVQAAAEVRARRDDLAALRARSAAHRAAIGLALAALGEAGADAGASPSDEDQAVNHVPILGPGPVAQVTVPAVGSGAGLPTPPDAGPKVSRSDRIGQGGPGRPSVGPTAGSGDPRRTDGPKNRDVIGGPIEGDPLPDAALGPLRDRAEAVVARLTRAAARRDELLGSIEQLGRQLEAARAQVRTAADRLRAWREAWARAVAPLGLPPEATPEEADAVLEQAANLAVRIKEAREVRARIESFEHEAGQFADLVRDLGRRVGGGTGPASAIAEAPPGPDLRDDPAAIVAAAQDLIRRLAAARQARDRRDALRGRREQEQAQSRSARRDREAAEHRLAHLVLEARVSAPEDLPTAERSARAARQLQDRIQELDQQLGRLCGHEDPEAFRRAATAVNVDRLPDRIAALAAEIDRLDADRAGLNQELGHRRGELARMDGEGRAAEANERVEHLKSRLAHEIEEYARLRLAAVVLREAIERYRHKTQGPILDRAGALFAALTVGSFEGLRVDYDDHDQPRLQALRPGGTDAVGIHGLSLGTADQLYLALRLASLETALESHGPVPLIADDVLIQFDDRRTAAALRALADLSARTQVILFTHHDRVCELARNHVDPDQLFIHDLPGRVGAPARGSERAR